MQERLSIGEVAARAGLAPSALRYYETEGLLPAPERVSGRRVYEPGVLRRIAVVQTAQAAGFTIREIRDLFAAVDAGDAPGESWRRRAESKLQEVARLEARAREMRRWLEEGLACGFLRLEDCRLPESAEARSLSRLAQEMSPLEGTPAKRPARKRTMR